MKEAEASIKVDKIKQYRKEYWSNTINKERANAQRRAKYAKDKTPFLIQSRKNRFKLKEFVWLQKNKPCIDCGQTFPPYVMHYDHKDPSQKEFTVSKMYQSCNSLEKIKKEIAKCDVVCANCHAIRTYEQNKNGYFLKGWHPNED